MEKPSLVLNNWFHSLNCFSVDVWVEQNFGDIFSFETFFSRFGDFKYWNWQTQPKNVLPKKFMRNAPNLSIVFHTISSIFYPFFTSGLSLLSLPFPHPTSFHFPRDLLTHVETSLFKRKNSIFYYMPTVAHITRQQQQLIYIYDHRPFFVRSCFLVVYMRGRKKGVEGRSGKRKMFYFSFDNKEEMFIRLKEGEREAEFTIR